jgi:hypothetical protein
MKKILKDPLIYFLLFGFGLFVLFDLVASDEAAYDSRVIKVDRDACAIQLNVLNPGWSST